MNCRRWEHSLKFESLRTVFDNIIILKYYGCHVKASKCQLIVNDEKYNEAIKVFKTTEIKMKKRARVLGFVIGSETECKTFLENITANRVLLPHQIGT